VKKAYYTSDKKDEIELEFDQPMVWNDALISQFYLDGKEGGSLRALSPATWSR